MPFTSVGLQLLQLLKKEPADQKYITHIASLSKAPGVIVKSGDIIGYEEGSYRVENPKIVE